jgi:hypothetical protein
VLANLREPGQEQASRRGLGQEQANLRELGQGQASLQEQGLNPKQGQGRVLEHPIQRKD